MRASVCFPSAPRPTTDQSTFCVAAHSMSGVLNYVALEKEDRASAEDKESAGGSALIPELVCLFPCVPSRRSK